LLADGERELLVDAKINFYLFVNASIGAFIVGVCLVVDKVINTPGSHWAWVLYVVPFLVSYITYRASIGPATDWGDGVRSSIDLHRLEMYEKLGIRTPESFSDEKVLSAAVNKALLFGLSLPDELWRAAEKEGAEEDVNASTNVWACIKKCVTGGA
jgi:hypothetical protein